MQILAVSYNFKARKLKFWVGNSKSNVTQFEGVATVRGVRTPHEFEQACVRLQNHVNKLGFFPNFQHDWNTWVRA